VSWSLRFAEPIVLADGAKLASLRESIAHLVKTIPAAERRLRAVLTAAEMLTAAAEHGGHLADHALGLPVFRRFPCVHAAANTPV
jgi:hypothetical protein